MVKDREACRGAAVHGVTESQTRLRTEQQAQLWASQVAVVVKNPSAHAGDARDEGRSLVRKTPWRRGWQPTLVFLPGDSNGQRSLVGYSS